MSDKTVLVLPGKRVAVHKSIKRSLQATVGVVLTGLVILAVIVGNSYLVGRGGSLQGLNAWLSFIKRGDIQATMILTAVVTVLSVYWQRDLEKK